MISMIEVQMAFNQELRLVVGSQMAVNHLIPKEHRGIAFLGVPRDHLHGRKESKGIVIH
jgi:hypothetical protein